MSYFELLSEVVVDSPPSSPKLISVPPSPLVPVLVPKELKMSSNVDIRSPRPEEEDVPPRLLSPKSPSPDDEDGPKRDELVVVAVFMVVEEEGDDIVAA